ncbi:flagellin [Paraburkholderia atlantica]|uniref:Flagellin n=1 Tax=Paraburkholderia atlantica TaxID=2654982 RepID=A0A6I1PZC3_PARAM|nr:flagellin [Paraburkholderia atlantica]MBB5417194.1 flagellin [Paraburkholderia atlantica]MBB5428134.1 flagellin [Paraburkholderia atlantica]MPW07348.1 flagellin [Paraburkholderia atlantica]NUY31348.1 flagellin [Paraburkholderia atlantica]
MLGINTNINSLVSQQNLTGSGSALSQAITRLSSGKRINSAADDAAGLAISNIMQTQINGLNQGVSNSNDGTSMVQTASSGLASLTSSLQRIRQLATQAANGSMTSDDRAALQKEVAQQISEVNRIASQTTYNGMNLLNGSLGNVSFQVGANVGQTISLSLTQDMSAAKLGTGNVQVGNTLGSFTGLSLDNTGATVASGATITAINVLADGKGGYTLTDQNNQALTSAIATAVLGAGVTITADAAGNATISAANAATAGTAIATKLDSVTTGTTKTSNDAVGATIDKLNVPSDVANIDISTQSGASMAMESIDNALTTLNNLQATLGAAQNRFSAIGSTQQAQSTDLSTAQSSIQDANFAEETANLSKAQVLQQAGISVLAQANSQPQQILKLLQ